MIEEIRDRARLTAIAMVEGVKQKTDIRMELRTDGAGRSEIVFYDYHTDEQTFMDTSGSTVIDDLITFMREQMVREEHERQQPDYLEKYRQRSEERERRHLEARLRELNSHRSQ